MIQSTQLERLRDVDPSLVSDCMLRLGLSGWMDGLRPVRGGICRAVGRARTLLFGPNRGEGRWPRSMYATIASLAPDDVLVIASGTAVENLMGDNVALMGQLCGLAAIVTDSPVRDTAGIAALSIPVFARGPTMRLPFSVEPVALDVPVVCAGTQVRPGDLFVGCEDGALIVPQARVADLIGQLESAAQVERDLREAIESRSVERIEAVLKRKKLVQV